MEISYENWKILVLRYATYCAFAFYHFSDHAEKYVYLEYDKVQELLMDFVTEKKAVVEGDINISRINDDIVEISVPGSKKINKLKFDAEDVLNLLEFASQAEDL